MIMYISEEVVVNMASMSCCFKKYRAILHYGRLRLAGMNGQQNKKSANSTRSGPNRPAADIQGHRGDDSLEELGLMPSFLIK